MSGHDEKEQEQNDAGDEIYDHVNNASKEQFSLLDILGIIVVLLILAAFIGPRVVGRKPVIYLYPTQQMNVTVQLNCKGVLKYTYPQYGNGWSVTAFPDGRLIDRADGREYSYLFWEGEVGNQFDFSKGFVVKGSDTVAFLQEKLAHLGLTPREYNEFIVYWLPQMQDNPYNLIAFQGAAYTDNAKLTITPEPDSVLRVFMAFKPLKYAIDVPPQELQPFERKGFAVVEWGGTQVHWQ